MFLAILSSLIPVFGLILLGVVCGRLDLLGERGFEVLNRFVISITLPILTFRTLAHMDARALTVPSMLVAVLGGAFIIYGLALCIELFCGRSMRHANIAGLCSCFSNTGFVGLPIALLMFGPASLAPVAVTMAIYSSAVFGMAVLLSEMSANDGDGLLTSLGRAGKAVSRSPLIILAILGILWAALRLPLSGPMDVMLGMLAAATAPCALVAIGLFVSRPREESAGGAIGRILAFKLIGQPLVTAGLILMLPPMPPLWAKVAILMAAMPAGTSSFLLAGGGGRWAMETSAWAIILTTTCAAVTLVPILYLLNM